MKGNFIYRRELHITNRMSDKDPEALGMAFARSLGGPKAKSAGEVLEFLQSKSAEDICAATTFLRDLDHYIPYPWLPIIDAKYLSDEDAFVPKPPLDLVREVKYNRTPIIYGHCKDEGICEQVDQSSPGPGLGFLFRCSPILLCCSVPSRLLSYIFPSAPADFGGQQ